jgi:hypothetical protein
MMKNSFILFLIFFSVSVNSQTEMIIGQISDKLIVRENFDEAGDFISKQVFTAGNIILNDGYYEIEVIAELFDKNKKSIEKYRTIYRCQPDDASMMVMAIPLANSKSKQTEINTTSSNFKKLYDFENLKDVEMELSFNSGLLKFLGSKSTIKIYDRIFQNDNKNIKSKINMKVYAWGIRIKQLNYNVKEEFDKKGLLVFQKFTEADGSYFTIKYTSPQ